MQQELEHLKHDRTAQLAFHSFRRQRLNICLDDANAAFVRLFQLSQLVGRMLWIEGEREDVSARVLKAEETVHECTAKLETAVATIRGFGAISPDELTQWRTRLEALRKEWVYFMGEAFIHIPGMAERFAPQKPSSSEYVSRWGMFETRCNELGELVHALPAAVEQWERAA